MQERTEFAPLSMPLNALRAVPEAIVAPLTQLGDAVAQLLDESVPDNAPEDTPI